MRSPPERMVSDLEQRIPMVFGDRQWRRNVEVSERGQPNKNPSERTTLCFLSSNCSLKVKVLFESSYFIRPIGIMFSFNPFSAIKEMVWNNVLALSASILAEIDEPSL